MIATPSLPLETNGTANGYAALFFAYISRSLDEALATVRAVQSRLADEERVQACHVLDYGLRAAESWSGARDLTIALATYMERGGHWEIWQQFLERAIDAAQARHDTEHEITLTALLARLYQRRGDAQAMARYYHQVMRLARRSGNRFELARACSNLGYHYIERGHLWRAEVLSLSALAIFDELDSNHGRAHTHNHLGVLFTRQYDWEKAKKHLLAACAIWQTTQDQFGLMRGYGNLGFLYNEIGNYEDGLYYSALALDLAERLGEAPLIGAFAANISQASLKTGNVQKAKQFASLAEKTYRNYSNQHGLAQIAHTYALIAIHEKDFSKAQQYINEASAGLTEYYFLVQVKLTELELAKQLQNYEFARQAINEIETLINEHLAGSALDFYSAKLSESRRCLASLDRKSD